MNNIKLSKSFSVSYPLGKEANIIFLEECFKFEKNSKRASHYFSAAKNVAAKWDQVVRENCLIFKQCQEDREV